MIVSLTFLLLAATPAPSAPAAVRSDPPVRVWLSRDHIQPGDWARVKVRAGQAGYLLVLASDVAGRVRVLFPLEPGADARVQAGRTLDLRGNGSAGSFLVGDTPGDGVVLAATTAEPPRFTGFVQDGHWDVAAIDSAARGPGGARGNPDEMLLGVAQQMTGGNQLDYAAATYTVAGGRSDVAYRDRRYIDQGYGDDGWDYYHGYAYPSWYGYGCFDPFFCSPTYAAIQFGFFYGPFYARPYYYRPFIRPFYPRVYAPYYGGRGYVGKTYIPTRPPVQYRNRGQIGYSRVRSFGGAPARRAFAPSFAPPRMATPSFRGSPRGGGGGGGGGRRR